MTTTTTAREAIRSAAQAGGWTLSIEADTDAFRRDGLWTIVRYSTRGTIVQGITAEKHVPNIEATVWHRAPDKRARVLAWFAEPESGKVLESPETPGADESANVHHESPETPGTVGVESPATSDADAVRTVRVEFQVTDGHSTYVDTADVPVNVIDYRAWIAAAENIREDEVVSLREAEINMDEVARLVRDVCGVHAYVTMTGGNTATIYADPARTDSYGGTWQAALAGPGIPRQELSGDEVEALGFDSSARGMRRIEIATPIAYARDVLRMIRLDVAAGTLTPQVADFRALHDHVDANGYLIDAGVPWDADLDMDLRLLMTNTVTGIVDRAIVLGALEGRPVALDSLDDWLASPKDVGESSVLSPTAGAGRVRDPKSPGGSLASPAGASGGVCPTCGQAVTR